RGRLLAARGGIAARARTEPRNGTILMSEAAPEQGAETPLPTSPRGEPRPRRPRRLFARLGLGLSAAIILILAVIGTEPYWQPALAPLLSWGPATTPA